MKSFNYQYTTQKALLAFIKNNNINDNEKLLIQIFSGNSTYKKIDQIRLIFKKNFSLSCLLGSTSDGAIIDGELAKDGDIIVVFTQFQQTELTFYHYSSSDNSFLIGQEIAKKIYNPSLTKAIISFTDGIHTNGEEYLNGLHSICPSIPVSGGMAGDNGLVKQTFIFSKDKVTDQGAIAVSLNNPNLTIKTSYSFNWTPIGKRMIVTRAVKNRVYEIDGLPAVDVYSKYMGKELARQLPQIGIEFPLIQTINNTDIGRAVLEKLPDGSLKFAGNIAEKAEVRFGVGNVKMILNDSKSHAKHLPNNIESIFVYSCMARRRFLGISLICELEVLNKITNISGFFTHGEFYSDDDCNKYLLNESMTVLALSENIEEPKPVKKSPSISHKDKPNKTNALLALSHLANTVSDELEQLNIHLEERVEDNTSFILKQVYTDRLTQLPNRTKLIKDIQDNKKNTMILINIDKFSMINDFYGHHAGDEILKQLAIKLRSAITDEHISLYRLSSDEFVILYPFLYTPEDLNRLITSNLPKVDPLIFKYENEDIHISVTVAVAEGLNYKSDLLARVNMALQHARKNKLRYALYHDALQITEQYQANILMAKKIRLAINNRRIVPFYQPIIELSSGKIIKYECLARLIETDGNIISPHEFLPIANKIRLYDEVTRLIITHAFKRFHNTNIDFTINLSINDILNPKTQDFIFSMIDQFNVSSQITFEILETQELKNDKMVIKFIETIQAMNGSIAIDDFGSGFSNFERMTRIKANFIKIDGSLIKNIDTDPNAKIVVETIINFANKLHMQVIAEFVHSKSVLSTINALGIRYGQGFFLGKPNPDLLK